MLPLTSAVAVGVSFAAPGDVPSVAAALVALLLALAPVVGVLSLTLAVLRARRLRRRMRVLARLRPGWRDFDPPYDCAPDFGAEFVPVGVAAPPADFAREPRDDAADVIPLRQLSHGRTVNPPSLRVPQENQ